MESDFDMQMIQRMATSMDKSITTSDHRFNKLAQDFPLPLTRDSGLHEIDRDKFQRPDHLPPPPPRPGIENPGDLESSSTVSSSEGDDYSRKSINYNRNEHRRTSCSQRKISEGPSNLGGSRYQIKKVSIKLLDIYAGKLINDFHLRWFQVQNYLDYHKN
jgi:hypothetical protein